MEKTVTMRMTEYEELLKFKEAVEKSHCVIIWNTGFGYEHIRTVTHNEAIEKLNYKYQELNKELMLKSKKWYQR